MADIVEYTGQLIGGPDDGNLVTASQKVFPVTSTTEMWLDGNEPGKEAVMVVWKGCYEWNQAGYFTWKNESNQIVAKQPQMV